ncbi:molybdopterin molybdotransferase MoeA [Polymorphobacter sp.]|uniref:molybdopterin molybdotransferase MoeA n=1 Tax=Polymorphobacter sp. TaxID=1909290 RepID=UPI003F72125F
MTLLHPDTARDRLLAGAAPGPAETIALAAAAGRVLAAPMLARLTQPPFAASAMDGWAVRWADMPGPFRIIGAASAGHGFAGTLARGETVRIFTGAPLPDGADTVIVQEEISATETHATLRGEGPPRRGAHIRPRGQDFGEGATLIPAGTRLDARHLGLAAAAGHGAAEVYPRPRVTLLATGDELVPPGTLPGPGQIVSSNGVMLSALLAASGAEVTDLGILRDDRQAIADAIAAAAPQTDLLITIGGASVGDHDLIIPALSDLGATLDFWKIALRPGKPLIAGRLGATRIIGLPGNPVSAYVCTLLFAAPLLRQLGGRDPAIAEVNRRLAVPMLATGPRRHYVRARLRADGAVEPLTTQDSAQLSRLAEADALIVRDALSEAAAPGETVRCILLDMFSDVA